MILAYSKNFGNDKNAKTVTTKPTFGGKLNGVKNNPIFTNYKLKH